jgi:hypothetical protein
MTFELAIRDSRVAMLHQLTCITKTDDESTPFTRVGNSADS